MFAFSLSRLALAGLVAALLAGLGLAFLAGRLTAPARQPAEPRPSAATPQAAAPAVTPPAAAPATIAEPPAPAQPPTTVTAPAPAKPQPPTPLAAALESPLARYGAVPPPVPADGKPAADTAAASPPAGPRTTPRELNPELGKLADAARPVYTVEVGEYATATAADQVVQRLTQGSYDVYRVAGWAPAGRPQVLSVRVGAYDQRAAAEAAANELRSREGLEARVLRVDPATIGTVKPAQRH